MEKFINLDVINNKLVSLDYTDEYMRYKRREWVKDPALRNLEANTPEFLEYRQKLI